MRDERLTTDLACVYGQLWLNAKTDDTIYALNMKKRISRRHTQTEAYDLLDEKAKVTYMS